MEKSTSGTPAPQDTYIDACDGDITDGDDYTISGDKQILQEGAWRTLKRLGEVEAPAPVLGKKRAHNFEDSTAEAEEPTTAKRRRGAIDQLMETAAPVQSRDIIDLTSSSPPREEAIYISSLVEDNSGNEDDVSFILLIISIIQIPFSPQLQMLIDDAERRAEAFERAAAMLREQASMAKASKIWLRLLKCRGMGNDVINMVSDVQRYEKTSRKVDKTWATGTDKLADRQVANTMGYVGGVNIAHK